MDIVTNNVNEREESTSKNHDQSYHQLKQQVDYLLNQQEAKLIAETDAHDITKRNLAGVESSLQEERKERIKLQEMFNEQREDFLSQEEKIRSQEEKIRSQEEKIQSQKEKIRSQEEKIQSQEEKIRSQEEKIRSQDALILEQSVKISRLEKIINEATLRQRTDSCVREAIKTLGVIVIAGLFVYSIKK